MFFWGYWILEIPSTLSVLTYGAPLGVRPHPRPLGPVLPADRLHRPAVVQRPARLAARRLVLAAAGDFPTGSRSPSVDPATVIQPDDRVVAQFYFLRFMLGLFEGGFFPSVILYLSMWFRPAGPRPGHRHVHVGHPGVEHARHAAVGADARTSTGSACRAGAGSSSCKGPCPIVAGFVTLFFLPNRPEKATWLPQDEKDWLVGELASEQAGKDGPRPRLGRAGRDRAADDRSTTSA